MSEPTREQRDHQLDSHRPADNVPGNPPTQSSGLDLHIRLPLAHPLVAAFGDSLMWGQGLSRPQRFSVLATQQIGALSKRQGVLIDRSRSGAKIKVRDGKELADFVDIYPSLFTADGSADRFTELEDQRPAEHLYGEVPSSFPTVIHQIMTMPDDIGQKLDVALVCGGANDLAFEELLDPRVHPGTFVSEFEDRIQNICLPETLAMLKELRAKAPNAVILLFGYHSPMSQESSHGALRGFFKHESGTGGVAWWFNNRADWLGFAGWGPFTDVDRVVAEAKARSVWGQGQAAYWLRRAVTDANLDDSLRGPGIVFVPCGFGPGNSAFCGATSMVWDDYTHPTGDPAQAKREAEIPRHDALDDMVILSIRINMFNNFKGAKALREKINGPTSMETALFTREPVNGLSPAEHLGREVARIRRALIASLFHPNTKGAARYAEMATARYAAHQKAVASLTPRPSDAVGLSVLPETFEERLKRFKLRGMGPLRADVGHQFIDAIRVTTKTSRSSTKRMPLDLHLVLLVNEPGIAIPWPIFGRGRRTLQLNMPYFVKLDGFKLHASKFYPQLEPGQADSFAVDVHTRSGIGLPLKNVYGMRLQMGDLVKLAAVTGGWMPEEVTVSINGVRVISRRLHNIVLQANELLDLEYPAPAPRGSVAEHFILPSTMVRIATTDGAPGSDA